jgi:hypothetical protein
LNSSNESLSNALKDSDQTKSSLSESRFQSFTLPNRSANKSSHRQQQLNRKSSFNQAIKRSGGNCSSPLPPPPPPPSTMAAALADHFGKDYLLYHPSASTATLPRSAVAMHSTGCDDCGESFPGNTTSGPFNTCSYGSYAHLPSTALRCLYDSTMPLHHNCHLDRLAGSTLISAPPTAVAASNNYFSEFTALNSYSTCSTLNPTTCGCETMGHVEALNFIPSSALTASPFTSILHPDLLNRSTASPDLSASNAFEQLPTNRSDEVLQGQQSTDEQTSLNPIANYSLMTGIGDQMPNEPDTEQSQFSSFDYNPLENNRSDEVSIASKLFLRESLDSSCSAAQISQQQSSSHSPSSRRPLIKEPSYEANI